MIRNDLLIHKTRTLLAEFLAPMTEAVDRPRKRFLQQVLRGILFSGALVVMELCPMHLLTCPLVSSTSPLVRGRV